MHSISKESCDLEQQSAWSSIASREQLLRAENLRLMFLNLRLVKRLPLHLYTTATV